MATEDLPRISAELDADATGEPGERSLAPEERPPASRAAFVFAAISCLAPLVAAAAIALLPLLPDPMRMLSWRIGAGVAISFWLWGGLGALALLLVVGRRNRRAVVVLGLAGVVAAAAIGIAIIVLLLGTR